MEQYDEKLRNKLEQEYEKKMENARVISDQLHEFKINHIKRIQEEMLQGEIIKRQTEDAIEQERKQEEERKNRLLQQREAFKKANEDLIAFSAEEKRREQEEEKKIE